MAGGTGRRWGAEQEETNMFMRLFIYFYALYCHRSAAAYQA